MEAMRMLVCKTHVNIGHDEIVIDSDTHSLLTRDHLVERLWVTPRSSTRLPSAIPAPSVRLLEAMITHLCFPTVSLLSLTRSFRTTRVSSRRSNLVTMARCLPPLVLMQR